jgi:hypothetical protein
MTVATVVAPGLNGVFVFGKVMPSGGAIGWMAASGRVGILETMN